jgi:hypothetical protein
MVIYLKPEFENQKPKKQRKSKRMVELEKEVAELKEEAERLNERIDSEWQTGREHGYEEASDELASDLSDWEFAKSELQEILDNMKYRKRVYEQAELRKIIEEILR